LSDGRRRENKTPGPPGCLTGRAKKHRGAGGRPEVESRPTAGPGFPAAGAGIAVVGDGKAGVDLRDPRTGGGRGGQPRKNRSEASSQGALAHRVQLAGPSDEGDVHVNGLGDRRGPP